MDTRQNVQVCRSARIDQLLHAAHTGEVECKHLSVTSRTIRICQSVSSGVILTTDGGGGGVSEFKDRR